MLCKLAVSVPSPGHTDTHTHSIHSADDPINTFMTVMPNVFPCCFNLAHLILSPKDLGFCSQTHPQRDCPHSVPCLPFSCFWEWVQTLERSIFTDHTVSVGYPNLFPCHRVKLFFLIFLSSCVAYWRGKLRRAKSSSQVFRLPPRPSGAWLMSSRACRINELMVTMWPSLSTKGTMALE